MYLLPPSTPPLPIQPHHSLLLKCQLFFSVVLLILMTLQTTLQLVCHNVLLALAQAEPVGMKLQGLQLAKLLRSLHVDRPVMIPRFPYGVTRMTPPIPVLLAMTMLVVFRVLSLIHLMELLTMPSFSKFVCTPLCIHVCLPYIAYSNPQDVSFVSFHSGYSNDQGAYTVSVTCTDVSSLYCNLIHIVTNHECQPPHLSEPQLYSHLRLTRLQPLRLAPLTQLPSLLCYLT